MNWLDSFFITSQDPVSEITGTYNFTLVALSVVIAVVASFIALLFASMTKHILIKRHQHLAVIVGSTMMAGGVWSMHFVGMLAYDVGTHVGYDTTLTFVSILPSLLASYITLRMLQKSRLRLWQLILSSICVGAGIGIMHYTGMAAMDMQLDLQYMPEWFAASIVVAVILAFVALSVRYYLAQFWQGLSDNTINGISAIIMGSAIAGMHYTGMAAAHYVVDGKGVITPLPAHDQSQLSYIVAFTALLISVLSAAIASQLRYRQLLLEKSSNETRLQTMMDTAVDGIMTIDTRGVIQDFNTSASDIFGWQPAEIVGQSFFKLVPEDAVDEYQAYLSSFNQTGVTQISGNAREVFAKHKDGHHFPIRLAVGHIQSEEVGSMFVGFVTDITERWEMQNKLRKSEEQYSSLVKNIPGASFRCLLDDHWTAILVSEGITELCGWTPDDFYQQRIQFSDLIHPEDVDKTDQAVADALEDKNTYTVEFRFKHRDGNYIWVLENGSIIWDADTPAWIDGLILDISDRVEMEENLRQAKEEAELSAESKARFLANMSHEIRTPMNAIIGFSDILIDAEGITDQNRKHLKTISQSARSLLHLLNDVLDSAKLEKDKLELDETLFYVTPLVDSVISTLWIQARNKGLSMDFDIADDIQAAYMGDENRLRQVLINLMGNAIKFTEEGSVSLTLSVTENQCVRFSIKDTGIGMDNDTLEKVFEPFSQADSSMSRRFGGTGLGTTISKQLVELMGGELHAESKLGAGSTFFFELPLKQAKAEEAVQLPAEHDVSTIPPQKILIADDIEQNLTLLRLLLERQQHHVIAAENGEQAFQLFKQEKPDIVLMDLQMPVMDGFVATQLIRDMEAEKGLPPTPVLALTASVLSEDRVEAKSAGMNGFAHKPIDMQALNKEMAIVLGLKPSSSSGGQLIGQTSDKPDSQMNLKQGISLWGDQASYVQQLSKFLEQNAYISETLSKLLAEEDYEPFAKLIHRLKGVSGNLSLISVYQHAVNLEQGLSNRNTVEMTNELDGLAVSMRSLEQEVAALSQSLSSGGPLPDQHSQLPNEEAITLIEQLIEMADRGELDEDMVTRLTDGIAPALHNVALEARTAMDDFEFTKAKVCLNSIKEQLTDISYDTQK
jgi:PAS domain S-box-containing protein